MVARTQANELALDERRKDEFLAMLGHELRNPLAALTSGLDLLRLTGAGQVEETRAMMERQTRRMTAMLDQLLDVARVISGKLELKRDAADLGEAARSAIETVRPMLEAAGHELVVSLPQRGEAVVLGDAMRLAQVIENLLGNAVKYTERGGRIWLALESSRDTVTLSVRDTGIGLEPAVLDHIFDLFSQAPVSLHRAKGGLGLGLPLVRSLVQMHGGNVVAHSAGPGQGTEVVVSLPRLRPGHLVKSEPEQAARPPARGRRILVVDDEADAVGALVEILKHEGHQARSAADGFVALETVGELEPEVVFLDLGLPKMDGYEVARNLRERFGKGLLLVALTGYRSDERRLEEAGFDGHLLKPTNVDKLLAWVAELDRRDEAATGSQASETT
jgi:two-component system CheB/CheR fusion protein